MGEFEKNLNQQIFKYNAYRRAAHSILEYQTKIKNGKEAEDLVNICFIPKLFFLSKYIYFLLNTKERGW